MIEKLLDNYYTKVLKELMRQFMTGYYLDYKFEELNGAVHLFIKKPEYNDEQYVSIYEFWKDEAIWELCRFEAQATMKILKARIKEYGDREREKRWHRKKQIRKYLKAGPKKD